MSVAVESVSRSWKLWLVGKILAGLGVGCLQVTDPRYISEIAPVPNIPTMSSPKKINIQSEAGAAIIYKDVASLDASTQEIRLLHLNGGSESSHLSCTLHRVALQSNPSPTFEALSYTWGDASDTREVIVNGYIVNVTFNLYSAFYRLRQEEGVRVLWIDALCINQTDLDERAQQVGLMGKIYSICDKTVIWVGEPPDEILPTWKTHWYGDERDDESIEWLWGEFYYYSTLQEQVDPGTIDGICHAFANLRLLSQGHLSSHPLFADMTDDSFAYPMSYHEYCELITKALTPFFESPWWTRIWTVQECILPPRATFIYGTVEADLSFILGVFDGLCRHMLAECCSYHFSRSNWKLRRCLRRIGVTIRSIDNLRASHSNGGEVKLWDTLTEFRRRHATDDRDRVHGVLGLVNSWKAQQIVPNYRITTVDVYCQTAISTALGTNSLLPLHYPLQKHAHPDLPSWVVDWTAASNLGDQLNVYQWSQDHFYAFTEAGKEPCHIIPRADNRILEVKGRLCDRVALLHTNPQRPYKAGRTYFDAFWRCLCWDLVLVNGDVGEAIFRRSADTNDSYEAFVDFCRSSYWSIFHPNALSEEEREAVVRLDPRFDVPEDIQWGQHSTTTFMTEQLIGGVTLNTTMFMTESGYLGLGPPETKVGDETTANGLNWVGHLTSTLNTSLVLTYDFAVSGATVDKDIVDTYAQYCVDDQVAQYKQYVSGKISAAADTLVAVWIGINDLGEPFWDRTEAPVDKTMDRYFELLQTLVEDGLKNFALLTVPPFADQIPAMNGQPEAELNRLRSSITAYNKGLKDRAATFVSSNSGIKALVFDTKPSFDTVVGNFAAYGAKDATCYGSSDCLWTDTYHAGGAIHKLVAQNFVKSVSTNFVF
ncbi:hypothetical protein ACJ41O_000057 [Fusarium nematophilum]